jgi:peptide/nickel transport system substrate-binding protein
LPGPKNSSQLVELSNEPPNSFDPASGFYAGEDDIMTNVYQPLVMFNYTSLMTFAPILASNWTTNSAFTSYTFNLRQDAWFMNGHPFNASVVWFNIYRVILMNQIGASYFTNILYNGTTAYSTGYALPMGVAGALQAGGYSISSTNVTLAAQQTAADLSAVLSHFTSSNATIQKIISYPDQAIVAASNFQVQFNLVNPYRYFLDEIAVPGAGQVDPAFVDANGGVQANAANTYVNTHTMGTAAYYVKNFVSGETLTMEANPNYWAAKLPTSQSNIMLSSPHIPVIVVQYATEASTLIQSISSNLAGLVEGPPIPALPPTYLPSLASTPGVKVVSLPTAPTFDYLMIALDTQKYPYNITNFRLALEYATNYSEIYSSVSYQYGKQYVGPISPGLPYYNPQNLPPYPFNPNLAMQLLKNLGFTLNLPNGTTINPGGKSVTLTLSYVSDAAEQVKIAQEVQIMYGNIGLNVQLNGITTQTEENEIFQSGTAASYPEMLIWYWYPSWIDPVFQDLVVTTNSFFGGIGGDVSWFTNSTVNGLTNNLPFETNMGLYNSTVAKVYSMVYQQAPDIWLYAVVPYWIQRSYVAGVFYNPGILGNFYPLIYYTNG